MTRLLFISPTVITATALHTCLSLLYYMSNMTMHFHISVALYIPGLLTELPHLTPVSGLIFFQPMFCTPGSCWRDTIYSNSLLFVCMCDLRQIIALYLSLPFYLERILQGVNLKHGHCTSQFLDIYREVF